MSSNTAVNDQITDAVNQSNVRVLAEAPAMAVSSLYQGLAHSTGILFENAVAAQQQQNILAQAAVNQGVMQIYSLDTLASGGAEQLQAQLQQSNASLKAASAGCSNLSVVEEVKQSLQKVLDSAGDVSFAVRSAAAALQASLQDVNTTSHEQLLRTLQLAAYAMTLRAMIADPGQADAYAKVMDEIRRLV